MEYILEELLRQRKALTALMNGHSMEKQRDSSEEGTARQSDGDTTLAETVWDTYMESDGEETGYRGFGKTVRDVLPEDNMAGDGAASGRKAAAERTPWRLGRLYPNEQTFAGSPRLPGGAEAVETVSVRAVTQWGGGTAEVDARELSRAVQRDARRYDGGFMAR